MSKNTQTHTRSRIIAIILAVMMILSVMPTTAFAADGDVAQIGTRTYDDFDWALEEAIGMGNGCTLKLLADVEATTSYSIDSRFTLDLNGNKLGCSGYYTLFFIEDGADLTLIDSDGGGSIVTKGGVFGCEAGKLTLGNADGTESDFTLSGKDTALDVSGGDVTVYGGTFVKGMVASILMRSGTAASVLGEGLFFVKKDDTTSVVDGNVEKITESVKVVSTLAATYAAQVGDTPYADFVTALDEASKEENAGCTVKLLSSVTMSDSYQVKGKFTLDLNDKKIKCDTGAVFYIQDGADLTVIDSAGGGSIVGGTAIHCNQGKLTLGKADGTASNFTIKGTGKSLYVVVTDVTVYGGTFVAGSEASIEVYDGTVASILGEGFSFVKKDNTASIVDSNVSKLTEPVKAVTTPPNVAQIGDTTYTELVKALDDASKTENSGCTVKLLSNVAMPNCYDIKSKFTLDLNGKKIECYDAYGTVFSIQNGADLTIIDSVGGGSIVSGMAIYCYQGKLTLGKADGTASDFTIKGTNISLDIMDTDVTVYGGTFIAGSEASIEMRGGIIATILGEGLSFVKKDDTTSVVNGNVEKITESVTVVNHIHNIVDGACACGFHYVAQIGETKYSNFEKALNDASKAENAGCTLTLLDDADPSTFYNIESKFTLDLNGKKIECYSTVFSIRDGGDLTIIDSAGGGSIVSGTAIHCYYGKLTLGKADGTANNFTISGDSRALYIHSDVDATIYGGTFVAGSDASIEVYDGTVARFLGEGLDFAKKDDTTSIVNGNVEKITESVTVVKHTHSFDENGDCACGAKNTVAQIGDTTYTDFVTALNEASKEENAGCTLKLLSDVYLSAEQSIYCTEFTLDLNGKKIEGTDNILIEVVEGNVTIIDSVGGGKIVSSWTALSAFYNGYITFGKADGTASDFTVSGKGCALCSYGIRATIYGGTYEAGSLGSLYIASGMGHVQPLLGDGYACAKKDDTTSIVNANVESISESVTVVKHTHSIVDGACACGFHYVAQIGETKYSNFEKALNEASKAENAGCTLTLLEDVKPSTFYNIESKFTLDLNGKKIERYSTVFFIQNGGDLTIIDSAGGGSIVTEGTTLQCNSGKLTLGKADGTANNFTISGDTRAIYIGYGFDVTIYGGTFVAGSDASIEVYDGTVARFLGDGYAFAKKDDTTSLVNGYVDIITESVTVVSHTHNMVDNVCACGFKYVAQIGETKYADFVTALNEASKAENAGCTLTLLADVELSAYYDIVSKFTLDLNGKKIEYDSGTAFYTENGADFTVIDSVGGGSISGTPAIDSNAGKLTLGKADGTASNFTLISTRDQTLFVRYNANVTIYGGTFVAGSESSIGRVGGTGNAIELLGEGLAFAKKDDTTSIVNGYVEAITESVTVVTHTHSFDENGDCACGAVKAVASIGDTTYTDLKAAFDDAIKSENDDCTVKLLKDIDTTETASGYNFRSGNFTFDLNGHSYRTQSLAISAYGTGSVTPNLTIIDSVGGGSIYGAAAAISLTSANVTFGKADGSANDFTLSGGQYAISIGSGTYKFYGGTYLNGTEASIKVQTSLSFIDMIGDGYAFVKVSDNSVVNADPERVDGHIYIKEDVKLASHTHSFDDDGVCACGKQGAVAQVGSTEYTDITQAFNSAKGSGATVKLLKNAAVSTRYNVNSGSLTVDLNGKTLTTTNDSNDIFLVNNSGKLYIIDSVGGGSIVSTQAVITTDGANCWVIIGDENGNNNFTLQSAESYIVNALYTSMLTIYGGTFLGSGTNTRIEVTYDKVINSLADNKALVKVSDTSSFVNSNQATITEDVTVIDHTHNVNDDGVCSDCGLAFSVKIGDKYFTTLNSTMNYISSSDEALNVYILKDIEEKYCNFAKGEYTIDLQGHSITLEECFEFDDDAYVTLIDTVGGGVISSNDEYNTIYLSNWDSSLTIGTSDGKNGVIINSEKGDAIYTSAGALTIYDGTFTGGYNGLYIYCFVDVNLYGGTFSSLYYWFDGYELFTYKALKLTDILGENRAYSINGNIVDATSEDYYFEEESDGNSYRVWYFNSTVSVVKHTHSYVDGKCACGYVQYAAQIGTNYYETIYDAIEAAENMTGKVELHILKNCKMTGGIELHAKNLWIYLDGNVLYSPYNYYYNEGITFCDGTYNICGDGMINVPLYAYYDNSNNIYGSNATVNIRGGIYYELYFAGSDTLNIYDAGYIMYLPAVYYIENPINIYGGTIDNFYVSENCVNYPILHGGKFGFISLYSYYSNDTTPYDLLAEGKGYYCNDSSFYFNGGTSSNSDWIEVKDHTKHVWEEGDGYCTACGEARYEAYVKIDDADNTYYETLEEAMEFALNCGKSAEVILLKDASIDSVTLNGNSIVLDLNGYTINGNKADTTMTVKNIRLYLTSTNGGTINTDIVIDDDNNNTIVYFYTIGTYNGDVLIKGKAYVVVDGGTFNGSFGFDGETLPNIHFTNGSFKKLYAPAEYDWNDALSEGGVYFNGTPTEKFTENGTEYIGFDGTQSGTYIVVAEGIADAVAMVTVPEYGLVQAFSDFDEAISYANSYSHSYVSVQISLLNDVSVSDLVQIDVTDVTLYLNGHDITGSGAIVIYGFDCRICGNGNVSVPVYAATSNGKQGTVIDGGTYTAFVSAMNGGKLQINNGQFNLVVVADGSEGVINDGMIGVVLTQSQNVNLTLNGGSYMSIVSDEEDVDFTKFLGKGKAFILGDAVYTVADVFGSTAYGYIAGEELIKVTKGTSVVSVNVNGLVTGGFNRYEFKVEGRASKLQVICANGSTYTLSRYSPLSTGANSKGLVSIKSYDKNGKEVSNGSADIAYEIWTVNMSLTAGTYEVKAKFANEWELGTKSFDIELETGAQVEQVTVIGTAKEGFNKYAVKVNGSAQKLQVIFFNGGTYTFDRNTLSTGDSSRGVVSIKSYDKNGKEVEYGSENAEYEIWVLNMSLKEGNYTVKAKCNGIWESIGKVFKVSFSKTEAAQVRVTAAEGENGKYTFTLNGTAQKLQIIHSSGATNTFTKDNSNVSVKYYNAKNVEVAADSYDVAYEVWTISKKLSDGEYSVIAKYDNGTTYVWNESALKFDVELSVLTAELTVATEDALLEELAKVKTTGGTVKLGNDITLSQPITLSSYGTEENPVILDLNGSKITGNIVAADGSFVEIQNGTIVYAGKTSPSSETEMAAVGCIESKLTIKNLTLNMTNSLVGIGSGDLIVEDCTINGGWNGEAFSNYTRTVGLTSTITFVGDVTVENIIFVNNMNGGAGAIFKANGTYSINGKDLAPTEDYTLTEADTEISEWYTEAQ